MKVFVIAALLTLLAAGTAVNYVLIGGALSKLSDQAESGRKARLTQCDREPVFRKVVVAAYLLGERLPDGTQISPEELKRFRAQAPRGCPR